MATVIRRWLPGLLGLAALAGLAAACDDALGPDRGRVHVTVQPRFAQHEAGVNGTDPALLVDNIRVVIVNETGDTVVDRIVEWPLDQDTLRVEVALEVTGQEAFDFTLQGRESDTVLFQARQTLSLSSDDPSPAPTQAVLEYAGPEATLEAIDAQGPAQALLAGDTVRLEAVGTAGDGTEIVDPLMVWTSLDTLAATVDSAGRVRVKHDGGRTVQIVGRVAFRTLADTLSLPVVPETLAMSASPDSITAIGWPQIVRATPLGVDGDTVRNVDVNWTVRDVSVVRSEGSYDVGTQAGVIARTNGATYFVGAVGPTADSVLVVVHQVVTAAAPFPTRAVLGVGDTAALSVVALDAGGTPVLDADPAVWTSNRPEIADVDAGGTVTAQSAPWQLSTARVTGEIDGAGYDAWIEVVDGSTVGPASDVSVGDAHSCWIENTWNTVYCRGQGEFGQLGDGLTLNRDTAVAVTDQHLSTGHAHTQVHSGGLHTCALVDTIGGSRAFCWGDNRFGQLGDGTVTTRTRPTPVDDSALPAGLVDLAAGGAHTCGLTGAGAAYCWGSNYFGQLGSGGTGTAATAPVAVTGGHAFIRLAAGWTHTCGLASDQTVWCWGRGEEGQLGDGGLTDSPTPVRVGGGQTFTEIVAGAAHSCGITADGDVECWGYNSAGQVGTGDGGFVVSTPTAVTFPTAITVTDLTLGWVHGCALGDAGAVYCWGGNDQLQLGRASPRVTRTPMAVPLGFAPTAIVGGGGETCAWDGSRMVCWGGIPKDYLGRDALVIPPSTDPTGGAFSGR
ncbi:MAG: hypothetical protein R6U63_12520 [Longimicrobiales bacterium]